MAPASCNEVLGSVILDPLGLLLLLSQDSDPDQYALLLHKKQMRRILLTGIWQDHQRGHFGLHEAAQRLAQLPFLSGTYCSPDAIVKVLQNRSMIALPCALQLLDFLREELRLRLFCLCNASAEELHALRHHFPDLFARFDATFTSCVERVSKPSLHFLEIAMEKAGISARNTLYLDSHDLESIVAARSLGMHASLVKPPSMNHQEITSFHDELAQFYAALIRDILLTFNLTLQKLSASPNLTHLPPLLQCAICHILHSPSGFASLNAILPRKIDATNTPQCEVGSQPVPPASATWGHRSDALASAQQFLLRNGANDPCSFIQHASLTSDGLRISDNFAQFVIADLLDDVRFLPMQSPPENALICFINKNSILEADHLKKDGNAKGDTALLINYATSDASSLKDIPEDLDTTSIGLSVLHKFGKVGLETIHHVLDKMLKYVSKDDGILQTYFDTERPRIDPVVVANTIYLFHLAKRGHEVERSERFVQSVLLHKAYEEGTSYYSLGEAFLVSVARLVNRFKDHFTRSGMRSLVVARLQEEQRKCRGVAIPENAALALLLRMHASALCGLEEDVQAKEKVVQMQRADGSWLAHAYCRNGGNAQSWIGNEGLTTAYACAMLMRD